MTKRDFQAAEYAAEERQRFHSVGKWISEQFAEQLADHRVMEDHYRRRLTLSVRIHAAAQRWCRYVWLKFLGR